MGDTSRNEAGSRRAEDELERLTGLSPNTQTTALIGHRDYRAELKRATKVSDTRAGAHARDRS
jgi:hypothetical protein